MTSITIDDGKLKGLLKQALVEVLEERAELLRDVLAEVVEDVAFAKAIKEGEGTETVSRNDAFQALE